MKKYDNQGRATGAVAYEIADDAITIQFQDGAVYLYDYAATGEENVEKMKELAAAGRGLTSFINREVKKRYARKVR